MSAGGPWALVPARTFRTGKSRLALQPGRAAIARALFDRVAGVLSRSDAIAGVLVATDGPDVAAAARRHGADVLLDDGPAPLAAIVDRGLAALASRGVSAAVVVMADLPLLAAHHVDALGAALAGADLVLAPDRDELGTNALAVRLPAPLATRFGHRDSFARHLATAGAAGLRTAVVRAHGLAFDLDLPADLDELLATAPALEAKARVAGQRPVGAEGRRRVVDSVERIAAIVAGAVAVRDADDAVQRRALGGDPPRRAGDPA